ncbi:MAG TPA: endolytic transglycosylase MltG [Candidatus Pacearchaeota archaeon]|nr:endolytic transglycosylase MltG [Candidatus Pacearchaeota archaeon]
MEKEKKSSFGKYLFILLVIIVIIGILIFSGYKKSLKTPNSDVSETISFQIKDGTPVNTILENLINANLLKKSFLYYTKVYLKLNNLGNKIQAGTYHIPQNLNIEELIQTLQSGKEQDIWVTIPEGMRKDEIASILEKELTKYPNIKFSKEDFLNLTEDRTFISELQLPIETTNLEGFLFPDKYAFSPNSTTESIITKLIDTFKSKVTKNITYDNLIMASIVEREGFNATDRPVIAGILLKRIKEGWLMQADATLLYPKKDWKYTITFQDLKEDNPYNTYVKAGLPPTPICNPGMQAINATLSPEESPYYFYIHDKEGIVRYAITNGQHESNKAKYLK